jgi:citronellol/citronellal dehydrogenase
MNFQNKTVFITGASRGIGKAIGLKLAALGANVAIAAKTEVAHPRLDGTVYTAALEMEKAGGNALPLIVDIRNEEDVARAVTKTVETFGGIDILINNASAIQLSGTLETEMKRFDLMNGVNARGTYMVSKYCIPHLLKSDNPHILMLSPPLNMETRWFQNHVAYSMAKFGMSMCVLGMAGEFDGKIGINALWPKTTIATAAVQNLLGGEMLMNKSRTPQILADVAAMIFQKDHKTFNGNFVIDEVFLKSEGIHDFSRYAHIPGTKDEDLMPDFFV